MFVAIVQPEIQSIETCQILLCVYSTVWVLYVTPQGENTFVGITTRISNK